MAGGRVVGDSAVGFRWAWACIVVGEGRSEPQLAWSLVVAWSVRARSQRDPAWRAVGSWAIRAVVSFVRRVRRIVLEA